MSDERPRPRKGKKRRSGAGDQAPGADSVPTAAPAPPPQREQEAKGALRPGWTVPHPEELPRPTFWPAALAFAVTFLLWGIVTSPIITAVGGILFCVSLAGWIGDIRHEAGH
jgi:hypothetical protein